MERLNRVRALFGVLRTKRHILFDDAFQEQLGGMYRHGMDRVLLERTVALVGEGAVTTAEGQQLSKAVRVAIDSRPLAEVGRFEDRINLLGHAVRNIVKLAAKLTDRSPEEICRIIRVPSRRSSGTMSSPLSSSRSMAP